MKGVVSHSQRRTPVDRFATRDLIAFQRASTLSSTSSTVATGIPWVLQIPGFARFSTVYTVSMVFFGVQGLDGLVVFFAASMISRQVDAVEHICLLCSTRERSVLGWFCAGVLIIWPFGSRARGAERML